MSHTCLSHLELDRLLAEERDPELRRRLDECSRCQARLDALAAERTARLTSAHVAAQSAAILARVAAAPAPRQHLPWIVGAPVVALAAAAVLLLAWPRGSGGPGSEVIRVKGGPRLEVVLAAPGPQRLLADGEAVPAGATLSFRAACPQGCQVALFAVGAGGVDALADATPAPWSVAGGGEAQLLPVSATLEGPPGEDLVVGFLCEKAPGPEALRAAVQGRYGSTRNLRAPAPSLPGCETRTHLVRRSGTPR